MNQAPTGNRRAVWLGILLSTASFVALFLIVDPRQVWASLVTADFRFLPPGVLGIVLFLLLRAVRWRFMLHNDPPYSKVLHIQNIGYLLTNLLPLRIGEVARAVLIGNVPPVTVPRGISTMVVERLLDMLFIITVFPFTLANVATLPEWLQEGARVAGYAAVGGTAVLVIAANQRPLAARLAARMLDPIPFADTARWQRRLDDLLLGLGVLTRPRDGAVLLLLSIAVWAPIFLAYASVMRATHLDPTLSMVAFVICVAALSIALPSSPGQAGVFHAAVGIALSEILAQPADDAVSFAFLYHALNLVTMVIAGLIGFRYTRQTFGQVVATTRAFLNRERLATLPGGPS